MTADIIPDNSELSATPVMELSRHGGHVGFIGGSVMKPEYWLETRVPEYLSEFI
jgi:predicted alpha/beta-fold hydrolase